MTLYAKGILYVNRELQLTIMWFYECGISCCDWMFYL